MTEVSTATALSGLVPLSAAAADSAAASRQPPALSPAHPSTPAAPPPAPAPDDTAWAPGLGAVPVGSAPLAAAVAGEDVWLAGSFTGVMAGMPQGTYNRIARWDGREWHPLGAGLDGTVHVVLPVGDSVFVGGEFAVAGGTAVANRLARWDGTAWSPVGGGVAYAGIPSMAVVKALACDAERLYVGGTFDSVGTGAGTVPAPGVAAYVLATGVWEPLGSGITNVGSAGEVRALLLMGTTLLVGGYFDAVDGQEISSLGAYDTTAHTWSGFGAGIRSGDFTGQVNSLALDAGRSSVYVGGTFTAADGVSGSGVVRLDGRTFTGLGAFTFYGEPSTATVESVAVSGGRVYAGGEFSTAGNAAASRWAVLENGEWSRPGDGVDNVVHALAAYGDGVVVAGDFAFSGPLRIPSAGIWTGTAWRTFGEGPSYDPYADADVYALAVADGGVYVGGYFDQAGALPVGSVGRWDGSGWDAMAGGVKGTNGLGTIYAALRLGTDLYIGGDFASAGGAPAANIASWDGTAWSPLGSGTNARVYALATLGDKVYAGGRFSAAGQTGASGVAVWDPATATWSALGNAPLYDDAVMGLAVLGDRYLVIGGQFNAFLRDGRDLVRGLNGMVLFDTQAAVDPADPLTGYYICPGVQRSSGTGTVRALQVLGTDLYVGGEFDTAGVVAIGDQRSAGFSAPNLAVWHAGGDGTWASPGGADAQVQAFSTPDGVRLVLGGWFHAIGTIAASGVAELDPTTGGWTAYGSGIGPGGRDTMHVEALACGPDGVWVGGMFNTAGGRPSSSLALWSTPTP